MKKYTILATALAFGLQTRAQVISSKKWTDLFSYNNVLAIKQDGNRVVCATENGLFFYNTASGELTKLSKANGLHEVKISAFDYNPETDTGLIGYANGSMDVITPDGVTYVVDIPIAAGFSGDKRINHISISGDKATVAVDYGVSIFDLKKKEFGQSTFFVSGGTYLACNEATIKDGKIYAATDDGLKTHEINVSLPVYSTWTTLAPGQFTQIDSDGVVAAATSTVLYRENGGAFSVVGTDFQGIKDVAVNGQQIIVADGQQALSFGGTGGGTVNFSENINTANIVNNQIFAGTVVSGLKDPAGKTYKPDGPYSNISYKIALHNNNIWVATGGRSSYNGPVVRDLGYYHFDGSKWIYPDYFVNNPIHFNVLDVIPNPADPKTVFFINYVFVQDQRGIYKMENNQFKKQYLAGGSPFYERTIGLTYDEKNNLFASAHLLDSPLGSMGYYSYNASSDSFTKVPVVNVGGSDKPIAKDGIIYIPAPFYNDGGVVMKKYDANPTNPNAPVKVIRKENGLPANGTVSIALDLDDDLWIGTREGLRVLSDPASAITELQPIAKPIIIEQNGIAEELFRDNTVLQIAVDSGNHKWVSVDGGGAYYLSANGQQTLKHFTKENSPIPTNSITDIKVDEKTGKVYFVTLDGIVVYQSDVADVTSGFGNVSVYPNPVVRANFKGNVTLKGLAMKTNIRITDVAGNLVHQGIARGGFYEWDLNNMRGSRVASGIYFVLMTNEDGTDKATAKIAVVN